MKKITFLQVYNAVRIFLDMYYQKTKSEDIGGILGGMQLCTGFENWKENPMTWDSAAWDDWMDGINKTMKDLAIKENPKNILYTEEDAFLCLKNYLDLFYHQVPFPDVGRILFLLKNVEHDNNNPVWKEWKIAIQHAINDSYDLDTNN